MSPSEQLVRSLPGARKAGNHWMVPCPAHPDKNPSCAVKDGRNGKILAKCWSAGCSFEAIRAGFETMGIWPEGGGGISISRAMAQRRNGSEKSNPSKGLSVAAGKTTVCNGATVKTGLNLQQYAAAKRLPVEFLKGLGLSDITYLDAPAVRMPYLGREGEVLGVRFRIALDGDRFRWKSGSKPRLYGLNRLSSQESIGYLVLVEGESRLPHIMVSRHSRDRHSGRRQLE